MKKRKQYRPKHILLNPVGYIVEGMKPVAQHDDYLIDLKIRNHGAMAALTQGRATRVEMKALSAMTNITVALCALGFGTEYKAEMMAGREALIDVTRRGNAGQHYILRGEEMSALNTLLELHDAQMDVISVKHIEQAIAIVHETARLGKIERMGE